MPAAGRGMRAALLEAALAVAAFAALCIVVLSVAAQTAEPDDGAYRASIVAMTEGHFLTLSTAQAETLARKLGDNPAAPPNQWVAAGRTDGTSARRTPATRSSRRRSRSSASSAGHRSSSGRSPASGCSSAPGAGSAASAASPRSACTAHPEPRWRSPGATTCRRSPTPRWSRPAPDSCCGRCWRPRRAPDGAPGSASPDSWRSSSRPSSATPNIVILGCAVVAVIVAWRLRAATLALRTLCWWLPSVAVFCAGAGHSSTTVVYGGPLTTGYQPGEVTFALGAIGPNLRLMPAHLIQAMPMLVLGLVALAGSSSGG